MAIVKQKNAKSGVTYVYESHSFRDPVTKQPRSTRKLIGKLDEETGEIVPTRKQNRKQKSISDDSTPELRTSSADNDADDASDEKDALITRLRAEIDSLKAEKLSMASQLEDMAKRLRV